ncbi:MAG: penicillin-binding protein [Candidatus Pacebacteria bacterium]|nr:penicillin-binding protein [Candidatus Paceibacterota bacterium]MBP9842965.1 penicillin-binding protein [Candidatus Paceibacterota bacterium]
MKKRFTFKRGHKDVAIDVLIFGFAGLVLLVAAVIVWLATLEIPDLSSFEERRVLQSTKIYDRTGEVMLYDLHQDVRRTVVPFDQISQNVKNATVAIEDDTFYSHIGIRPLSILQAGIDNIQDGDLLGGRGGSTITQQVIKNSVLQREKTFTRKAKEAILALKLEQLKTKDEILEIYLNESPYGGTIYGIEEASRAFFNTSAKDLTIGEAAYLAAIPQAPTYLSPYGNNRDALDARQKLVLEKMRQNGYITVEEYEAAKVEVVEFEPQIVSGIKAPHFVMYIREILAEKYGEEALAERGLKVVTTLDWELQKEAERIVAEKAAINTEKFKASNAGLVATDPKTGDVLVMVGSRDYFDENVDGNFNLALANRQPGSSIKPFIYARAFEEGYLPTTILFDVKTQFSTNCEPWDMSNDMPCYSPNNHNNKTSGPVSMRNALAQSMNIPAVKTLYLVGIHDALKLAADMGITTLGNPDRYGLTLVLGGGEVKLLDMTHAYGVFANKGVRAEPRNILRIEDTQGNIIEEFAVKEERVLDENTTNMISDVLSDNVARTPLWGSNNQLRFDDRDVAAKSGSTNNFRDAWIMGYAPNIAVGAWCGNNDNSPMQGLSGLITTPMWREFMDIALSKVEAETFTQPYIPTDVKPVLAGNYVDANILIAAAASSSAESQLQFTDIYNNIHTILHYVDKNDPRGPYPTNPQSDGQYKYWEYGVQKWKEETFGTYAPSTTTASTTDDNNDRRRRRSDDNEETPESDRN